MLIQWSYDIAVYNLTDNGMIQWFLHQGTHYHSVGEGTRAKVQKFISQAPLAGPKQVQVSLAKEIVLQLVIISTNNKKKDPNKLDALMDELEPLFFTKK